MLILEDRGSHSRPNKFNMIKWLRYALEYNSFGGWRAT